MQQRHGRHFPKVRRGRTGRDGTVILFWGSPEPDHLTSAREKEKEREKMVMNLPA